MTTLYITGVEFTILCFPPSHACERGCGAGLSDFIMGSGNNGKFLVAFCGVVLQS